MGKPSPNVLRELAISHYRSGKSNNEISELFAGKLSIRTVSRWIKDFRDTGKTHFIPTGRPNQIYNHLIRKKIKRLVKKPIGFIYFHLADGQSLEESYIKQVFECSKLESWSTLWHVFSAAQAFLVDIHQVYPSIDKLAKNSMIEHLNRPVECIDRNIQEILDENDESLIEESENLENDLEPIHGKFNWRCVIPNCASTCSTYSSIVGEHVIVKRHKDSHDKFHQTSPIKLIPLERRRNLAQKATVSNARPRKIITDLSNNVETSEEIIANIPSYNAERQFINRIKNKSRPPYPQQPNKLSEIAIPEFLQFTKKGESFLFYDSGVEDEDRFFIFTTESNLKNLEKANLYVDGTFDITPKLFSQVYTVHALVNGRCLPMLYGLLTRKTEFMYTKFLTELKIFDGVNLYGCFFHYKQLMWRKITELGLKQPYSDYEQVRLLLKIPQCLAFIPPDDVVEAFKLIQSKIVDEKIKTFYKYIEDNYVGSFVETKTGRGRGVKYIKTYKEPFISIRLWNVYSRINECLPRTNNFVESWHNAFSSMLNKHPLVYSLIDSFIKEQNKVESDLVKLKTGLVYKRKSKYVMLDERIKSVISGDDKDKIEDFLKNFSFIINYFELLPKNVLADDNGAYDKPYGYEKKSYEVIHNEHSLKMKKIIFKGDFVRSINFDKYEISCIMFDEQHGSFKAIFKETDFMLFCNHMRKDIFKILNEYKLEDEEKEEIIEIVFGNQKDRSQSLTVSTDSSIYAERANVLIDKLNEFNHPFKDKTLDTIDSMTDEDEDRISEE
ncbi:unnamed protein product [Brachionus calyciflorus]|uniref:Uncharacterized protein n=1 Tax=Brachionus calyciflorus TaxID=104777 RepID=A0A813SSG4_9BILA|nr:unnamed protein product [Brachionus calyciflorus]